MSTADVGLLAGRRVLVVGDLVLDEYITGRPARVSREAPVLILDVFERQDRAGSAASPAANVLALGSQATVVGVVGCDGAGERIEADLAQRQVDTAGLIRWAHAATSTKTRILAQGYTGGLHGRQQVLRLDQTTTLPLEAAQACTAAVTRLAPNFDAVLLSDYRGGVVSEEAIDAARASGRLIAVDSQGDLRRFRGVDLLKVNQAEAQAALGTEDVLGGGEALRRDLAATALVITLGADGMLIFDGRAEPDHVPAVQATQVFDVTGAGDTVIAVLTLGLIAGLSLRRSAELASAAASVVVRRLGVAVATSAELLETLRGDGLAR
ncbi:MAG TPA: PfkB family carbohydrate kinase [Chloroflexota bacterium]|nr:PfkB family carbohydrate kinase [Chloroflexota bacterium]